MRSSDDGSFDGGCSPAACSSTFWIEEIIERSICVMVVYVDASG